MAVHQHLRDAVSVAFRLLKHRELIGIHWLIFVDGSFDVPAREIAAIAAGKRSCSQAANGNTLPIAIVDISGNPCDSGVRQGETQRALPCRFWNCIAGPCG